MTPQQAAVRVAVGYALAWLIPLAWWACARLAQRRGLDESSEFCDDCARIAAANMTWLLPLATGALAFFLLVGPT